ncbi:MAG: hypothetical protein EZS28_017852, partial [Streblomastix strix]
MLGLILLIAGINHIICLNVAQEQATHSSGLNKFSVYHSYSQEITKIIFADASTFASNMFDSTIRPYHNCECKNSYLNLKLSQFPSKEQVLCSDQHLYQKEHESYDRKITHDISSERYVLKNSLQERELKDVLVTGSSILVSSTKLLNQITSNLILIMLFAILHSKHANKAIILHLLITLLASLGFYDVSAISDLENSQFTSISQSFTFYQTSDQFKIKNCTFTSCSNPSGGALQLDISNGANMSIIDSTFSGCSTSTNGGAIYVTIRTGGNLTISGTNFDGCRANQGGGGIYIQIFNSSSKLTIMKVAIVNCNSDVGGGIHMQISEGQFDAQGLLMKDCRSNLNAGGFYASIASKARVIFDRTCEFVNCETYGNGGAMYLLIFLNTPVTIFLQDVAIHECKSYKNTSQSYALSGFGGGIFIDGQGPYDVSSRGLNFKGMKFDRNKAEKHGQSMYVVMKYLENFCLLGIAGEYVKGNYSDYRSNQEELMGYDIDCSAFYPMSQAQIEGPQQQQFLEELWDVPYGSIWHVSNRVGVSPTGVDSLICALISDPCNSIEFVLKIISDKRELSPSTPTSEKRIGITQNGFDLNSPIQFNTSTSYTNVIKIMKQQYGTNQTMIGQAQLMIKKGGSSSSIENGQSGWIQAVGGIELRMYGIDITTDQSILTIPVIYVQDSNTLLELDTVTFSGINLSPTSQAKGIVHINTINGEFIAYQCNFEYITIQGEGGNAIRLENNSQSTLTECQFKNINSIGESNGQGGSAIFADIESNCELVISGTTQFESCISTQSSGGAIYAIISGENSKLILQNVIQFVNCQGASGGGISTVITNGGSLQINGITSFNDCISTVQHGGGIHASIEGENSQMLITAALTFDRCESNENGGGIYTSIQNKGTLAITQTLNIHDCSASNGGAMYLDIDFSTQIQFILTNAQIQQCHAIEDITFAYPTGYGGGIFLTGTGEYDVSSEILDLSGININDNTATKAGQSLYIIMSKLKEWCRYGIAGEYVKGNYSDVTSNQNELEGIPIRFDQFQALTAEQFVKQQRQLEYFWTLPQEDIWHLQTGTVQLIESEDQYWCGNIDEPCESIEYILEQISVRKGGSQSSIITIKKIGINEGGFELTSPFEFNQQSYTNDIKIMKQMYGTLSAMNDQAEIKIKKNNDDSKEVGKSGWISVSGQINLRIYEIKFITDQSQLTIPVIYVQDSNTLLELDTVTFSGINLSTTTQAKGIVHINVNNQNFIAQNSIFEGITIEGEGGNAIRFDNNANSRVTASITNCQFKNINAKADSNGHGGSAIFAELRDQSSLIIDSNCQFIQCINNKGNGGAIYIDIDFNSLYQFNINDALIKDCHATADTTLAYPTGYGGGIFLTGSGDFDISSPTLDLSGMNISGNAADKAGQSLYVASTELQKWCNQGTFGQYVKGNYSEAQSDIDELEGILVDQSEFATLTQENILEQQYHLEYFWSEIVTLTKVDVTINQSNSSIPVSFAIEGTNMHLNQLSVKIIDQGAKTQNNQNELILNILNSSSISSIFQFFTQLQHNKQQILNRTNAFETIYPPNDGTSTIDIVGEPQNEQEAYFDMHGYSSWFNYDDKEYGVLASNNRRIFTGIDGKERKAVQLSTNIVGTKPEPEIEPESEEELEPTQPKSYHQGIPWWVFLLIGVGILLLLLSLLCCCCCYYYRCCCWGKDNSKEKEKETLMDYNQDQENQQQKQTEMRNFTSVDQSKADYSNKKSTAQPQQEEINQRITKEPYQQLSIERHTEVSLQTLCGLFVYTRQAYYKSIRINARHCLEEEV